MNNTKVEIIFENCDMVTLPPNCLRAMTVSEYGILLLVDKLGDVEFREFGLSEPQYITTVFERLRRRDIVRVVVQRRDTKMGFDFSFGVPYIAETEVLGAPNKLQVTSVNNDGSLEMLFYSCHDECTEEEVCGNIK